MRRAALIIAFNTYHDENISSLRYSENDGRKIFALLEERMGFETECLIGDQIEEEEIVNEVRKMTQSLGPEDLFVLFYAGHGLERENQHWLLLPKADLSRLRYYKNMISINELKDLSEGNGCNRLFILDACRNQLIAGTRGSQDFAFQNRGIREVIRTQRKTRVKGSLGILCSCDEGQVAKELPSCKQGVFTAALIEEFKQCLSDNIGLKVDLSLCIRLQKRMSGLSSGFMDNQRPWLQCSGELPLLFDGPTENVVEPEINDFTSCISTDVKRSITKRVRDKYNATVTAISSKHESLQREVTVSALKRLILFAIGGYFLLTGIIGPINLGRDLGKRHLPGIVFFLAIAAICFWNSRPLFSVFERKKKESTLAPFEETAVKILALTFLVAGISSIIVSSLGG